MKKIVMIVALAFLVGGSPAWAYDDNDEWLEGPATIGVLGLTVLSGMLVGKDWHHDSKVDWEIEKEKKQIKLAEFKYEALLRMKKKEIEFKKQNPKEEVPEASSVLLVGYSPEQNVALPQNSQYAIRYIRPNQQETQKTHGATQLIQMYQSDPANYPGPILKVGGKEYLIVPVNY